MLIWHMSSSLLTTSNHVIFGLPLHYGRRVTDIPYITISHYPLFFANVHTSKVYSLYQPNINLILSTSSLSLTLSRNLL